MPGVIFPSHLQPYALWIRYEGRSLNFRALTCMARVGAGCDREPWSILGREENQAAIHVSISGKLTEEISEGRPWMCMIPGIWSLNKYLFFYLICVHNFPPFPLWRTCCISVRMCLVGWSCDTAGKRTVNEGELKKGTSEVSLSCQVPQGFQN